MKVYSKKSNGRRQQARHLDRRPIAPRRCSPFAGVTGNQPAISKTAIFLEMKRAALAGAARSRKTRSGATVTEHCPRSTGCLHRADKGARPSTKCRRAKADK